MDEFCPLCRKNGCSNKVKPVQLNFHEAVYLCESETCHWPYGYEEFKIIPRSVDEIGKLSPKKSNVKSAAPKMKDGTNVIPISTELSMYTPPVTPSNDGSSKELVKGTTPSSILDNIFDPATNITNNHGNKNISHTGKTEKPRLGDSCGTKNNSTSKTPITSTIAIKKENMPLKVSSIFDIDSSVTLSTINPDHSQIETVKYCDIRNDDEKNNQSSKFGEGRRAVQSSQLALNASLPIQNGEKSDVVIREMKSEKKFKSAREHPSDQSDRKLMKKVVIFKEKISNGSILSEDKVANQIINCKRPPFDDINSQISGEQTPKKIQRVSSNQEPYIKEDKDMIGKLPDELMLENCAPIIKSIRDISIDETTGQSHAVNNSKGNILNVSQVESKKTSISADSLETSVNVVDSLNLDSFIDENFLENCPNTTQDIDDDWLRSFLL